MHNMSLSATPSRAVGMQSVQNDKPTSRLPTRRFNYGTVKNPTNI